METVSKYCYLPNLEHCLSSRNVFVRLIQYLSFAPNIKLKSIPELGITDARVCVIISPRVHPHLAFGPYGYDITAN